MTIERRLVEEFNSEIDELRNMDFADERYKTAIDGVTKLADRIIEIQRIEAENQKAEDDRESDIAYKKVQLELEQKNRKTQNLIELSKIIVPSGLALVVSFVSMNFEKEGTFTTEAGRNSIRKLLKF